MRNAIAPVPYSHVIEGTGRPDDDTEHENSPPRRSPRFPCRLGGADGSGTDGRIDRGEPIGESSSSHSPQSEPIDGDAPVIDWHGETWQAMGWEVMADYITACGYERHRKTEQAALPAWRVGGRGEGR